MKSPVATRGVASLNRFPRPRLVISRCLELDACRYNAVVIRTPLVRRLEAAVDLVPVCPEVEVGLGVPRDPIRLVSHGGDVRLVQPSTARDLTAEMEEFAVCFLAVVGDVDGFLLKARSPSCGPEDVSLYRGPYAEETVGRRAGVFAAAVRARFPDAVIEHEASLSDPRVLHRFLAGLFAAAGRREARVGGPGVAARLGAPEAHPPYPPELLAEGPVDRTIHRSVPNDAREG